MTKIVFLDAATLGDTALDPIAAQGELVTYPFSTPEEALLRVGDADVVITNKVRITEELLGAAPRCRLVCEAATGVNNIDLEACARRGIPVRNVAGYSTESVVQETYMHILSLMGSAPYLDSVVKNGTYSAGRSFTDVSRPIYELAGKTLGIIGLGTIGTRVARVGQAFGMDVIYYSTSGTSHSSEFPSVPLEQLMATADVISVHAPLNGRTAGLVGAAELALMKPTAIIVNMGRGGIISEEALADAIDRDAIGGAGLDVFCREPLPADNPLLHTRHGEKLRFTPHTAWASLEARARLVAAIAENISSCIPNA